jgi:hypothetical protein
MKEIDIYKILPKKNCRECSAGTCMAFAVSIKKDPSKLKECPYLDEGRRDYLRRNIQAFDWRDELIKNLEQEIARINLIERAQDIGATLHKEGIVLRCTGRDYLIRRDGMIIPETENKWIRILILHYIRKGGKGNFTGEWISFRDLRGGIVKASTFERDCINPLKELIDEDTQRAIDILMRIGGVKIEGYPSDISIRIDLLPKVRLLILYSKGDNEFGSSLNILFDKITDEFLDVESLIFLLEGLVHTVRYMFSSRTLE